MTAQEPTPTRHDESQRRCPSPHPAAHSARFDTMNTARRRADGGCADDREDPGRGSRWPDEARSSGWSDSPRGRAAILATGSRPSFALTHPLGRPPTEIRDRSPTANNSVLIARHHPSIRSATSGAQPRRRRTSSRPATTGAKCRAPLSRERGLRSTRRTRMVENWHPTDSFPRLRS